jgi:hypothetical protein
MVEGGIPRSPKDLRYIVLHHTQTGLNAKPENVVYIDRVAGKRYPAPYHQACSAGCPRL